MTTYAYRITVDSYPTPDGRPFVDMGDDFYARQVYLHANPGAGDLAAWLPDSFGEWIYADEYPSEPAKIGRTVLDGDDYGPVPLCKVPLTRRRHWLSRATAVGIAAGLREWGAEVRLERCALDSWQAMA